MIAIVLEDKDEWLEMLSADPDQTVYQYGSYLCLKLDDAIYAIKFDNILKAIDFANENELATLKIEELREVKEF